MLFIVVGKNTISFVETTLQQQKWIIEIACVVIHVTECVRALEYLQLNYWYIPKIYM